VAVVIVNRLTRSVLVIQLGGGGVAQQKIVVNEVHRRDRLPGLSVRGSKSMSIPMISVTVEPRRGVFGGAYEKSHRQLPEALVRVDP
jgi:hypothetical protein